jgi:hypothetical protein
MATRSGGIMTRLLILFAELFTLPMRLTSPFNRAVRRILFNLSVPLYARELKPFEPNLNLMLCTTCQERDHAKKQV